MSFCFVTFDFLENRHRYKKRGLTKFLTFAAKRFKYIEENENYFIEMNEHFKEEYELDAFELLGLKIEESGEIK